jgi:hypothetical protein
LAQGVGGGIGVIAWKQQKKAHDDHKDRDDFSACALAHTLRDICLTSEDSSPQLVRSDKNKEIDYEY